MFMVWLLWIIVVFGCLFMGLGAIQAQTAEGFDLLLTLNALFYLGCSIYGMPKLYRLIFRGSS